MVNRPFLRPKLRLAVNVSQAEERFTASVEDTLKAEVSYQTRERDVITEGGIITAYMDQDEVVFDIEDDVASLRELNIIQEEIINAFDNYADIEVDEEDIVVKAEIVRVITAGLDD